MAVVLAVLMLPSYILHKLTGCDVFNVFLNKSSLTKITFSSLYCILFVFASVRFLSLYVDILITALNSNANRFVLAVGILLYAHTVRTKVCLPHQDVLLSVRLLRQFL